MVELGTRDGVSTRALLAAAEICHAHVLSIDIADCSRLDLPERFRARWTFVCADDVAFASGPFAAFCAERGLPPFVDVVFVDTSHAYEHTRAEIEKWMPRLSPRGIMLFHDTNMAIWFRRLNGKVERGADNGRGVICAIEEFLGRRYDEATYFTDVAAGYLVSHVPWSSGLTILRKLETDWPPTLTPHQRHEAVYALRSGTATQADLARRFDVSQSTISWLADERAPESSKPMIDSDTERAARAFLRRLEGRYPVREAILYGSRARRTHNADSDADIAVVLDGEPGDRMAAVMDMAGIAFHVMMETGVMVEAMPLWFDELARPETFKNPALVTNILSEGIRL
jgi:predicted nucleotidyltransferase